jgi:hypothetical protein
MGGEPSIAARHPETINDSPGRSNGLEHLTDSPPFKEESAHLKMHKIFRRIRKAVNETMWILRKIKLSEEFSID